MNSKETIRQMSLEIDALLTDKEDLSIRLEKAQEEVALLRGVLGECLRTCCTPIYPDEIRAQEAARKALLETL